jgi:hypothetical protein
MGKTKKDADTTEEAVDEETVAAEADEEDAKPKKAGKRIAVSVTWSGGTREYSKEVHGDNFEDLAQEFATKHGGTVA